MSDYLKMKELAEALLNEMSANAARRFLTAHGYDAEKLEDMGFSQSYLSGLGFEIE